MPREGRPRRCTPAVIEKILKAMNAGAHRDVIADYAGISRATLFRFLADAEAAAGRREKREPKGARDQELCDFWDRSKKAEAEGELGAIAVVTKAMKAGDWKAAMTFLERRYPERWARRTILANPPAKADDGQPAAPGLPFLVGAAPGPIDRQALIEELERRGLPTDIFEDEG